MNSTAPTNSKAEKPFAQRILEWYRVNARAMPWRIPPDEHEEGVRPDPYHVWLSEVMLQQTQVATVQDYFLKFIRTWPRVHDLAAANLEDVLRAWAGLGYYSRARNLKKCGDTLVAEYQGKFPETVDELKQLPGIGDYTASAIASIAFDQPVPVLDGNIERVMARHQKIETEFPKAKAETKALLETILDQEKPGEFAQAMMDLGATICTPKNPTCALCPINEDCKAFKNGDAELYPKKQPKAEKPTRKGAAFVIVNSSGQVFLCKRGDSGLLAGMTQVPTTEWTARQDGSIGSQSAPVKADWKSRGSIRHTFTHFYLVLEVWAAEEVSDVPIKGWWCEVAALAEEALPTVMRKVLEAGVNE